ncbi:plasmid replication protein RepA (plasmid) [Desulfovibrio ferrophilus]|uniref:Plasmid replication protein RepA n=2 Tax=Desulfovibrio ferrophilus TaxID=241368 RepID=A0A2Z6B3S9_9BACT|nr:plasmid replication protein RepA [Desulfovibrio ferrophilus]
MATEDKDLTEVQQRTNRQLTLFESILRKGPYSGMMALDALMPKYFYGKATRTEDGHLKSLERVFDFEGQPCKLIVDPARVTETRGKYKGQRVEFYMGTREENVYDALLKLAKEGQGKILDDQFGVVFSLNQIIAELKNHGHTINYKDLIKSLKILRGTSITFKSPTVEFMESPLLSLGLPNSKNPKSAYVRFNSLVDGALKNKSLRLYNYQLAMGMGTLARKLLKLISYDPNGANLDRPYEFRLVPFLSMSGYAINQKLKRNVQLLDSAVEELKIAELVQRWDCEQIKEGRKIIDYKYKVWPSEKFRRELVRIQKAQNDGSRWIAIQVAGPPTKVSE